MRWLLIVLFSLRLFAASTADWEFERINLYFENDVFSSTDSEYSDGSRLSTLLYRPEGEKEWWNIPFTSELTRANFISFSLTQQMYTPADLTQSEVIKDDRPYAGWLYFQSSLHLSSERHLDSLSVRIGVIGPASKMHELQDFVHKHIGSEPAQGWDNQLHNELGLQLNYQHKWRYVTEPLWGVESSFVPYVGGEFGNISIKANAGALLRLGFNVPEDFGSGTIDEGGVNGIPVRRKCLYTPQKSWSANIHFAAGGSVVGRDIFLDGNTFNSSHSVTKKPLKAYGSFGFSARYKSFNIDYIETYHTQQFEGGSSTHSIGSVIVSYIFSSR